MSMFARLAILTALAVVAAPGAALAYVGPGAGLGMIGSLVAVIGAVLLALVGLIVLPFRMLMRRRKAKASDEKPGVPAGSVQDS